MSATAEPGDGEARSPEHRQVNHPGTGPAVYIQHGDLHVYLRDGQPTFRVEPFAQTSAAASDLSFSQLLTTQFEVVDFVGREDELHEFVAWRDATETPVDVVLLHGPGGQGKSRLATEFARMSATAGWRVCGARHQVDSPVAVPGGRQVRGESPGANNYKGLLLVIDYVDRWPYSDVVTVVEHQVARHHEKGPIRVLLLARSTGPWWEALSHHFTKSGFGAGATPLGPVATTIGDRRRLFVLARDRFAEVLDVPNPELVPVPTDVDSDACGQILTLHMAALAGVDAHAHGEKAPTDVIALSEYFLRREKSHWQANRDRDPQNRVRADRMARAVYCATLMGPLSYDDAIAVVTHAGLGSTAESATEVVDDHRANFPPRDHHSMLAPLLPDRLGEDYLALQAPGHDIVGYQPDAWATGAPGRVLLALNDDRIAARALTRLIEVTRRWPHVGRTQLYPLLRDHPELIAGLGSAGLIRLVSIADVDITALEAIALHLPEVRDVDRDAGAADLVTRLVEHHLAVGVEREKEALLHRWHSFRLTNAARYEEATAAAALSVEAYRKLAADDPAHQEGLATALVNLTVALDAFGHPEAAVEAARETVEIRTRLVDAESDGSEAQLAMAESNLAALLFRSGDTDRSIAIAEKVVQDYERLSSRDPEYVDALAAANANLGMMLSHGDAPGRALEHTERAVALFATLAERDPAHFAPDLADAMSNLAVQLLDAGQTDEGLRVADDAFLTYQRLVAVNPRAYEPGLARLLSNISATLREVDRIDEAFAVATAAADIHKRLPPRSRDGYELVLEQTLRSLVADLFAVGDHAGSAAAAELAAEIRQQLADLDGVADARLESALSKLTVARIPAALPEEAVDSYREAVRVHFLLDPETHRDCGLSDLGQMLADVLENNSLAHLAPDVRSLANGLA